MSKVMEKYAGFFFLHLWVKVYEVSGVWKFYDKMMKEIIYTKTTYLVLGFTDVPPLLQVIMVK